MSHPLHPGWEAIIGLEIHLQLNTRSKLFARSPNRFGDEPNTNIDVIDTGQPGALPVLNKKAVEKAVLFGCAIQAKIARNSKFDRKSYFYPDSPRNFQITQFYDPIITEGTVLAEVEGNFKKFGVAYAHLEDDAGMLKHFSGFAGVDFNRAGAPLLEIVSKPCISSSQEAVAYAMAIRSIAHYLDISDCNMEEGSFRMDTNVSVRPVGETKLRSKVEVKNMNSFTNMAMAIEAEVRRQIEAYEAHPDEDPSLVVKSETVRFDLATKKTVNMRFKESASDYRYFPEPDLPPVVLSENFIEKIRQKMPELPYERLDRYVTKFGLTRYNASILVDEKALADYFEEGLKFCENPTSLCNWITVEFVGRLKESGTPIYRSKISSKQIASLVNFIDKKKITGRIAKEVADIMVQDEGKDPGVIIKENPNFQAIHETSTIEPIVEQVITENSQSLEDLKAGKEKAFNHLVGQVMKLTKGRASPEVVKKLLSEKIRTRV